MSRYRLEPFLLALTIAFVAVAIMRVRPIAPAGVTMTVPPTAKWVMMSAIRPAVLVSAAATFAGGDPFRLERTPPLLRFGEAIAMGVPPLDTPRAKSRPSLSVKAIVGGPPWSALVEGLPQTTGAIVVRDGWRQGEFAVTAISRDTVVVAVRDTVWKFTMKREVP